MDSNDNGFAWLIEAPGARYLGVWSIGHSPFRFRWVTDANQALRFFSHEQADGIASAVRALEPDLWGFAATLGEACGRPITEAEGRMTTTTPNDAVGGRKMEETSGAEIARKGPTAFLTDTQHSAGKGEP